MSKSILLIVVLSFLGSYAGGADDVYKANPNPPTDGLVGAVSQRCLTGSMRQCVIGSDMTMLIVHQVHYPVRQDGLTTPSETGWVNN